jgi:hypothetical protein
MIRKWIHTWLARKAFNTLYRFATTVPLSRDEDARAIIALDMLRKYI